MRRAYVQQPSSEWREKYLRAKERIVCQTKRDIRCPHCNHIAFAVYSDSVGFIETKCKKCKREVLIDLVSMRRTRMI